MPNIKFILHTLGVQDLNHKDAHLFSTQDQPKPAKSFIPEDYKKLPSYICNDMRSETVKKCMPFLDALTSGYIIPSMQDYIITLTKTPAVDGSTAKSARDKYIANFTEGRDIDDVAVKSWFGGNEASHSPIQLPKNYQDSIRPVGKFYNKWIIKTPPGYSCLFIHPLNHPKSDYEVVAGIVDTDTYNTVIFFPYYIRKEFTEQQAQIFLKKGTPMVQVIPFKRETWTSWTGVNNKLLQTTFDKHPIKGFGLLIDMYKKTFWQKKNYD
jgi:hypothetical protein